VERVDCVIAGCGPAGAGLGLLLARAGLRVTVVEMVELSLFVFGSFGCWLERLPVFEIEATVEEDLIWARIRQVLEAPEVKPPPASEPDQLLPADGSQGGEAPSTQKVAFCSWPLSVSVKRAESLSEGPVLVTVST